MPVIVLVELGVVSKDSHFNLLDVDSVIPYMRKGVIQIIVLPIFPESPEAKEVEADLIALAICEGPFWEIALC